MKQATDITTTIDSCLDMLSECRHSSAFINNDDKNRALYLLDRLYEEIDLVKVVVDKKTKYHTDCKCNNEDNTCNYYNENKCRS